LRVDVDQAGTPTRRSSRLEEGRHWLRHSLGFDRAVAFTVLARGWSSAAGLITVALIAHFLAPVEQGYYYTFASLIALQMVFELGFSQVVMQLASHERAHLTIAIDGSITGDAGAHARLASVLQTSVRWYGAGALLFGATLIPAGLYFFSSHRHVGEVVQWPAPWIAVAVTAVLAFQLDPLYSFFEGCGFVSSIARMRWIQAVLGSALAWLALTTHHGLFAPAMAIGGQVIIGAIWLARKSRLLRDLLTCDTSTRRVSWKTEIWPFQWRIAISWISGYFVYQTFNPFLFAFKGPVAAGRMGMSLSFANAILAMAMAWVSTKAAPFGTLIAQKRYHELDRDFFKALRQSVLAAALGSSVIWSAVVYLDLRHNHYAAKLLSPLPFGLLLIAGMANHVFGAIGTYLRAHKQEKLFMVSLSIALLVLLSNYFFARTSGALGMISSYLVILTLLGVGGGAFTLNKYRRVWHSD
jgi:hypothetical protein